MNNSFFSANTPSLNFKKAIEYTFNYAKKQMGYKINPLKFLDDDYNFIYDLSKEFKDLFGSSNFFYHLINLVQGIELIDSDYSVFETFSCEQNNKKSKQNKNLLEVLESIDSNVLVFFRDNKIQKRHLKIQCSFVFNSKLYHCIVKGKLDGFHSFILSYRFQEDMYIISAPLYYFLYFN